MKRSQYSRLSVPRQQREAWIDNSSQMFNARAISLRSTLLHRHHTNESNLNSNGDNDIPVPYIRNTFHRYLSLNILNPKVPSQLFSFIIIQFLIESIHLTTWSRADKLCRYKTVLISTCYIVASQNFSSIIIPRKYSSSAMSTFQMKAEFEFAKSVNFNITQMMSPTRRWQRRILVCFNVKCDVSSQSLSLSLSSVNTNWDFDSDLEDISNGFCERPCHEQWRSKLRWSLLNSHFVWTSVPAMQ